ncbi:MAG: hypothetical protein A2W23_03545 [Planctomycetes bacterium RBG_16_43_13]|nr:MAG: hypothetical protein A2W23_03545 [Planctomycetes bacterium RBG_16_43_13]
MSVSTLVTAIIFSSIGLAYFIYGKKQRQPVPLVIGILLMVYPYFIPGLLTSIIVGLLLTIIPFIAKRMGV